MTNIAAKTPTTAITRALRSVGLTPGKDFRVTGHRENGERKYTFAYVLTLEAGRVIAEHADEIERVAAAAGFPFTVFVRYFQEGRADRPSVSVDNSGRPRVREEKPAPQVAPATAAPSGNVTVTLSAEWAAKAMADLKALRESDPAMTRYTPAVSVVLRRLEDALSALAPTPDFVAVDAARRAADARIGGALTGDVTDPCETQDAPATPVIVTRPQDLDPAARYALWVCGLEGSHGRGVKCSGHSMRATGTGAEMAAVMGLYRHAYAEHIG